MKICVKCQLEYNDKYTFCQKCGCKLELKEEKNTCSNCGNVIETNGGFCPFCGASFVKADINQIKSSSTTVSANQEEPSKRSVFFIPGIVFIVILVAFFIFNGNMVSDDSIVLSAAKHDGKWGMIDAKGNWFIQPQFAAIGEFSEGLAPAYDEKAKCWGFIDKTGKWIVEPKYESAYFELLDSLVDVVAKSAFNNDYEKRSIYLKKYGFSEGLAPVKTSKANGRYGGYIDKNGNMVINSGFAGGSQFKDGYAIVVDWINKERKYGAVDKKGNYALAMVYEDVKSFSEGLFVVKTDRGYAYVKPYDSVPCSQYYDSAEAFSEGLAIVKVGNAAKLINKNFQVVKDLLYIADADNISYQKGFKDGKIKLSVKRGDIKGDKWHYKDVTIDRLGNLIKHDLKNTNGLNTEKDDLTGKFGYTDENDSYKINPQYDLVEDFSEGVAVVTINKKKGMIDVNGRYIEEPTYDYLRQCSCGLVIAGWDDKVGALDTKGNIVIPNKFEAIDKFKRYKKSDLNL